MDNICKTVVDSLFNGDSPNSLLFMKFVTAFLGGLSVFFFKQFNTKVGEPKIKFIWKGLIFTIVSMFGGVFLIAPSTAFNAFACGLIGWTAISNFLHQQNEGASFKGFYSETLKLEQIQELIKEKNNAK